MMNMLHKTMLIVISMIVLSTAAWSQNVAIVDVSAILESMTEYSAAQTELDRVAAQWNQEIAQQYDDIKSLYNKYQAEQVLLSDEMKAQREEEIMKKEKAVRELQHDRFGPEGELFNRRMQLVSPIQDRVYSAIEAYSNERNIDIVFDKSSATGLLFAKEQYDKTDEIKRKLGL